MGGLGERFLPLDEEGIYIRRRQWEVLANAFFLRGGGMMMFLKCAVVLFLAAQQQQQFLQNVPACPQQPEPPVHKTED